jgi:hypothetical protein
LFDVLVPFNDVVPGDKSVDVAVVTPPLPVVSVDDVVVDDDIVVVASDDVDGVGGTGVGYVDDF